MRSKSRSVVTFGTALVLTLPALALPALAQTPRVQTPPAPAADDSGVIDLDVTAKRLDAARTTIQPSLGATKYEFSPRTVENLPQGDQAPLGQVLLRAPGVAQDSFGQVHIRGDHANLQYRLDGVQLPETLSLFSQSLATQFAHNLSLMTGALPAQYGFRQAGVVDITLKSGTTDPGAEASATFGSRDYKQSSLTYGGRSGIFDYFATGQFLHSGIGIENPTSSYAPLHDDTDQWHALAKLTAIVDENTRLSFIGGGAKARFQIPTNPNQTPGFTVAGTSAANSALLDQRQWENTYFGIVSLQKHYGTADFQLSGFTNYSTLAYKPDPFGDLLFNGIAPWSNRVSVTTGAQGDGSWKASETHTLRAGFLAQREHATISTRAQVLPVDDTGAATSDQPIGIVNGADQVGWTFGAYVQDEWKLSPTVTLNYGVRFDAINANTQENQLSPRANVVWQPNSILTAHVGYARYFTPPPLSQVNNGSVLSTLGTTAAPAQVLNDPVKAERSHYFDAGFSLKPLAGLTLGFDAYYKIAQNLLDEGQFGAPIVLSSFNYANAQVKGVELSASYDDGPWSIYANAAWSEAKGSNINSAQFNFQSDDLAYIAQNYIYLDHNQSWTGSGGAAYTFNMGSDWTTRLSGDVIVGSGLRADFTQADGTSIPNGRGLPTYATVNMALNQKIPIKGTRGTQIRLDAINLLDNSYQLRDGTGVGVGAPQFGQRRTLLVTVSQKF
jgi:outer membrane receptor protein involved in Fe transport